jgi:catechol 2,3-dioxygenase-like lactoylglutathione lyase family enzyme
MELQGIHHVGLTVPDDEASAAWYERVLGLTRPVDEPHHDSAADGRAIVLGPPDRRFGIGLDRHPDHAGEGFDPTRTGLDHLCLLVGSVEELHAWAEHLTAEDVKHSGVYGVDGRPVQVVTFCDPDGVQLELVAYTGSARSGDVELEWR